MRKLPIILFLCVLGMARAEDAPNAPIEIVAGRGQPVLAVGAEASAADVLRACRAMLPVRPVELKGALVLRSRKGIVTSEHDYRLVMRRTDEVSLLTVRLMPRGETNELATVTISRRSGTKPVIRLAKNGASEAEIVDSPLASVQGTDVTWLDLSFDFLWWPNAAFEAEREGESIHGQKCVVVFVRPEVRVEGLSGVRLWVDKKTGCLMQAEQVDEAGKPIRRLWGTRVKKMDGKWMVSVLEVETLGSRHRTKITVEGMLEL